jgi:hypothetical protein
MKIKNIVSAIKSGRLTADNTVTTEPGKFAYSGLMVIADRNKVSVYKGAGLAWSSMDEHDIKLCRAALFDREDDPITLARFKR